ncbi:MAG: hypothetical protein J6R83_00815 [Clostridia bacterium]|nr:hypothetical protein [Clostridia bacterium]
MLEIIDSTGFGMQLEKGTVIAILLVPIIIRLLFYVLRGAGIYVLSKRAGVKQAWMGFVPCIWIYPLLKTLKNEKFFSWTFGKLATLLTVIFALSEAFAYFYSLVEIIPVIGYYLQGGTVSIVLGETDSRIMLGKDFYNPLDTTFMTTLTYIIEWVSTPLDLVALIVEVFAFVALFKKYWANNYILGTVLSVLGLFGLMVFIIRKKQPRDFNEYLRSRYSHVNNPYGPNQYGAPQQPTNNYYTNSQTEDPFKDFSSKEDPFSEFDNKDNK